MRVLYTSQARAAEIFEDIGTQLQSEFGYEPPLFVGSDRVWYKEYCRTHPKFSQRNFLGEWQIAEKARTCVLDTALLAKYEKMLGQNLWVAARCDRRLISGKKSAYTQDYKARCTEDEILKRLQVACVEIEKFFDLHKPDAVIGFICVTYVEYIATRMAQARGIPILNFRSVRMKNYVTLDTGIYDPPQELISVLADPAYEPAAAAVEEAADVVNSLRNQTMLYEGAAPIKKISRVSKFINLIASLKINRSKVRRLVDYFSAQEKHTADPLVRFVDRLIKSPWKRFRIDRYLKDKLVKKSELTSMRYAFFPLHLEPEIALLLFAPAFQNQIEVARSIAFALPAGMKLLIKDHPLAFQKRSLNYYKKLLEIPNVRLADPTVLSKDVIENCDIVTTIGGSIGLEALIRKKPVMVFSPSATYRLLHGTSMLRYNPDLNSIDQDIFWLLHNYKFEKTSLNRFLAAALDTGFPMNLYTGLLQRKDGYRPNSQDRSVDVAIAATQINARLNGILHQKNQTPSLSTSQSVL